MADKDYSIVIGGDIFPCNENINLFINGDIQKLFGEDIINKFKQSDFSILNLEGVLSNNYNRQEKIGPVIVAQKESINAFSKLGVSAVTLANNHITDCGQGGCVDTINTLKSNNIQWLGVGTNNQMKDNIVVTLGDKRICIYSASEIFWNKPTDSTIGANVYDEYVICNKIRTLKKCSDYVIVIFHAGAERFEYATPIVRERCHRMAKSGADVIITQHSHCIGCEEYYEGSYILYGQGNFLFKNNRSLDELEPTLHGLLLELVINDKDIRVEKSTLTSTKNYTVSLDKTVDLDAFHERSIKNQDTFWVNTEFQKCKKKILSKFLYDLKGKSLYWKTIKKFFPNKLDRMVLDSYTRKQLLMIKYMCEGDRSKESVVAALDNLLA